MVWAGTRHDFNFQASGSSSDQNARRCKRGSRLHGPRSAPGARLLRLTSQGVVAGLLASSPRLPRHHFPFLYKNNIALLTVLTAHQIPSTVFLPSPCLFLFIWPLYFRDPQSLCWPRGNVLFYFWLHSSHASASIKKRTWGGRGSGLPVCCLGVFAQSRGAPPLCRAGQDPRVRLQRRRTVSSSGCEMAPTDAHALSGEKF